MRKLLVFVITMLTLVKCFTYCSDDPVQSNGGDPIPDASSYYPGNVGSTFIFSIDTIDNTGTFDSVGLRTSSFNRLETINSTEYIVQINMSNIGGIRDTNELRFRSTRNGIYFYIDTTGFSEYDSLVNAYNLTLKPDEEFKAFFSQSLNSGLWTAFIFNVDIPQYGEQTIIRITAHYDGEDEITIKPINNPITSKKINYQMIVVVPDSNLTQINQITFESTAWFAENIGLVQLSGNGLLINTLTSGRINFADSNKTIRQTILDYNLR